MKIDLKKENYPCLYLSGVKGLKSIPKNGTAMIKYKVVERDEDSPVSMGEDSIEIEIHSLEPKGNIREIEREPDDFDEKMAKANKKETYE